MIKERRLPSQVDLEGEVRGLQERRSGALRDDEFLIRGDALSVLAKGGNDKLLLFLLEKLLPPAVGVNN